MTHNEKLAQLIKVMTEREKNITSHDDILSLVQLAKDFDGELYYDHRAMRRLMALGFFGGLIFLALQYFEIIFVFPADRYLIYAIFLALFIIPLIVIALRAAPMNELSKKLFQRDFLLDNLIEEINSKCSLSNELISQFREFRRGISTDKRGIAKLYHSMEGNSHSFHYYKFYYTVKEKRNRTNADGERVTETVECHHYRYGLVFDCEYGAGLAVMTDGSVGNPVTYSPSYTEFSERFHIGANSDHEAAKLLKPAVMELLMRYSRRYTGLNIEISNNGLMCISFKKDVLNTEETQYGLSKPNEFYEELSGKTSLYELYPLLDLHDDLIRHWDNNFTK